MNIGILGSGNIGATLAKRLAAAGHEVKVANSRGPETISPELLSTGAHAVHADDVITDVDALIVSIPLARLPEIRPLIDRLPTEATVLDTSNYYPVRDGTIEALENGQPESVWVAQQLGRPIVKAWNAILAGSFADKDTAPGDPGRIAIPVAADSVEDRKLGISLVEQTGFDGFDSGTLAESWRQQPGAPSYCTDLTKEQLPAALAAAVATRSPKRRDLAMQVIRALMDDPDAEVTSDFILRLNRLLYP
jgi:8-hydroxy-5-deazaflavin:NADPH oxidoreductase